MVKQKRDYEVKKELVALFLFVQYKHIFLLRMLPKFRNKDCIYNYKTNVNQISTNEIIIMRI